MSQEEKRDKRNYLLQDMLQGSSYLTDAGGQEAQDEFAMFGEIEATATQTKQFRYQIKLPEQMLKQVSDQYAEKLYILYEEFKSEIDELNARIDGLERQEGDTQYYKLELTTLARLQRILQRMDSLQFAGIQKRETKKFFVFVFDKTHQKFDDEEENLHGLFYDLEIEKLLTNFDYVLYGSFPSEVILDIRERGFLLIDHSSSQK